MKMMKIHGPDFDVVATAEPEKEEQRARIAEAQRRRWRAYREGAGGEPTAKVAQMTNA